jgi:hypothetical protein
MKRQKKIARLVVAAHTKHNVDKHDAKIGQTISSIGTERIYRQSMKSYMGWCDLKAVPPDLRANITILMNYLEERSKLIRQKTLDQDRQALQMIYKQKLPFLRASKESVYSKRSYTMSQLDQIIIHQAEKNAITSELAFYSGLRAHESATILPLAEREPSVHRKWNPLLFIGFEPYKSYTVVGKGGLIREVAVPHWLASKLEDRRKIQSERVVDREIFYKSHYDIGIGQAWSQSFSAASKKALGYSTGGHGLRHGYAKSRLGIISDFLKSIHDKDDQTNQKEKTMLILSQELGHFRPCIILYYLR